MKKLFLAVAVLVGIEGYFIYPKKSQCSSCGGSCFATCEAGCVCIKYYKYGREKGVCVPE